MEEVLNNLLLLIETNSNEGTYITASRYIKEIHDLQENGRLPNIFYTDQIDMLQERIERYEAAYTREGGYLERIQELELEVSNHKKELEIKKKKGKDKLAKIEEERNILEIRNCKLENINGIEIQKNKQLRGKCDEFKSELNDNKQIQINYRKDLKKFYEKKEEDEKEIIKLRAIICEKDDESYEYEKECNREKMELLQEIRQLGKEVRNN